MAMLEGHELERELLGVVGIIIIYFLLIVGFREKAFLFGLMRPLVRVQLICNRDKEVRFLGKL